LRPPICISQFGCDGSSNDLFQREHDGGLFFHHRFAVAPPPKKSTNRPLAGVPDLFRRSNVTTEQDKSRPDPAKPLSFLANVIASHS
jgi:hypothetical protein